MAWLPVQKGGPWQRVTDACGRQPAGIDVNVEGLWGGICLQCCHPPIPPAHSDINDRITEKAKITIKRASSFKGCRLREFVGLCACASASMKTNVLRTANSTVKGVVSRCLGSPTPKKKRNRFSLFTSTEGSPSNHRLLVHLSPNPARYTYGSEVVSCDQDKKWMFTLWSTD